MDFLHPIHPSHQSISSPLPGNTPAPPRGSGTTGRGKRDRGGTYNTPHRILIKRIPPNRHHHLKHLSPHPQPALPPLHASANRDALPLSIDVQTRPAVVDAAVDVVVAAHREAGDGDVGRGDAELGRMISQGGGGVREWLRTSALPRPKPLTTLPLSRRGKGGVGPVEGPAVGGRGALGRIGGAGEEILRRVVVGVETVGLRRMLLAWLWKIVFDDRGEKVEGWILADLVGKVSRATCCVWKNENWAKSIEIALGSAPTTLYKLL